MRSVKLHLQRHKESLSVWFLIFANKLNIDNNKKLANKTRRNQRLISTSKIQEITKEAEDFSTFQIYFLPFQYFLELEKIPKHEDCKDKLISFTFEQMKKTTDKLVFISHRWLSQDHPDPHSLQLNAIKDSFKSVWILLFFILYFLWWQRNFF